MGPLRGAPVFHRQERVPPARRAGTANLLFGELPPWLTIALAVVGLAIGLPQALGPKLELRFYDDRLVYRGQSVRVEARDWFYDDSAVVNGVPMAQLIFGQAEVRVPWWAQPMRIVNGFFGHDPTELVNIQVLVDAAEDEAPDVHEALLADLRRHAPPPEERERLERELGETTTRA